MSDWNKKPHIFIPSLAHFPFSINICILDFMRVRFWKENILLRVSPIFSLIHSRVFDFIHFYFRLYSLFQSFIIVFILNMILLDYLVSMSS